MLLKISEKPFGVRAVDDAVIKAQRKISHVTDRDVIIAIRGRQDLGAFLDFADAEDCDLWLVDDRRTKQSPEDARVGNGECTAGNFVGFQLFRPRPIRQIVGRARQAGNRKIVSAFDYRHD